MRAVGEKDERAFNELYSRYSEWIYVLIKRKIGDEDCAKDIAQNVWICLWKNAATFPDIENIHSFLYVIAARQTCNMVKWRKDYLTISLDDSPEAERTEDSRTPESTVLSGDICRIVGRVLASCPKRLYEIWRMRASGHSVSEVAEELNVTAKTIRNGCSAVRQRIREKLVKFGAAVISVALFKAFAGFLL